MIRTPGYPPKERGVVLIIALIVLVAMTLAAVALIRTVDISTQISGNLAFRQSGVQAADAGVELARRWLMTAAINSLNNNSGKSYYATSNGGGTGNPAIFDPTSFDWTGTISTAEDSAGNTANYVIHRMCDQALAPSDPNANCFMAPGAASGDSNRVRVGGESSCVTGSCSAATNPYYRISVRVTGPKNTVTYIQAVIY